MKQQVYILWPNPSDTKPELYTIDANPNGTYTYTLTPNDVGTFSINSDTFLTKYHSGYLSFSITSGATFIANSYIRVLDENSQTFSSLTLNAGQNIRIVLYLNDKSGKVANLKNIDLTLAIQGRNKINSIFYEISNKNANELYLSYKFVKKGVNSISVLYSGYALSCKNCDFSIAALQPDFKMCEIYKYDVITNSFQINTGEFFIRKTDTFQLLLVMNDIYGNPLDNFNIDLYTAVLSGNNMKEIKLILSSYGYGGLITIVDVDKEAYNLLVGRSNYLITVTEKTSAITKAFKITLLTDGRDADAGNGNYDLQRTELTYISEFKPNNTILAGNKYQILLKLKTMEELRCNYWLDDSKIKTTLETKIDSDSLVIKRNTLPGTYIIEFVVKLARDLNNVPFVKSLFVEIEGNKLNKVPFFNVISNDASYAIIPTLELEVNSQNQLRNGESEKSKGFTVSFFDSYNNPSSPISLSNLIVLSGNISEIGITNLFPDCKPSMIPENLMCSLTTKIFGNYTVKSSFFKTNYYLYINMGPPSSTYSEANLFTLSNTVKAGDFVNLKITPKDSSARLLTKTASSTYISMFSANSQFLNGEANNLNNPLIQEDGSIFFAYQVLKAKSTFWEAKINGIRINCGICSLNVDPAEVYFMNSDIYLVIDGLPNLIGLENMLTFENKKRSPIFNIRFNDKFKNELTQVPIFNEIKGYFTCIIDGQASNRTHNLKKSLINRGYKWEIENSDAFTKELYNDQCSLIFSAQLIDENPFIILFSKVIIQGDGKNDKIYGIDGIDLDKSNISPSSISIKAGSYASISLELRTSIGKLFKFEKSNDYIIYDDLNENKLATGVNKQRGFYFGVYLISFTYTLSSVQPQTLKIGYISDANEKIFLNKKVTIQVNPDSIAYLTIENSQISLDNIIDNVRTFKDNCNSGQTKSITMLPKDKYNNLILKMTDQDYKSLNLIALSSNNVVLSSSITQNEKGEILYSFECQASGKTSLTGLEFRDPEKITTIITKYALNVVPGDINAANSIFQLSKNSIVAGDRGGINIELLDKYKNKLDILTISNTVLQNLTVTVKHLDSSKMIDVKSSLTIKKSEDLQYFYASFELLKSGKYEIKLFFSEISIKTTNNILTVQPSIADWSKTSFALYNGAIDSFESYQSSFKLETNSKPLFNTILLDQYENIANSIPPDWSLLFYIVNANDVQETKKITFCISENIWSFCDQSKNLSTSQNGAYYLKLIELKSNNRLKFDIDLVGSDVDSGIDPFNPVKIENTVIFPQTRLNVIAGQNISFIVELRTINKEKRVGSWYEDPSSKLSLSFSDSTEKITYFIEKGEKIGRYIFKANPTKVPDSSNPNLITLKIENTEFTGFRPELSVKPAEIQKILILNPKNVSLPLTGLVLDPSSVDTAFTFNLIAYDKFGNKVFISEQNNLAIEITNPAGDKLFYQSNIDEKGQAKISFQPKLKGEHKITVFGVIYSVIMNAGGVSLSNSFGTFKSPTEIAAGTSCLLNLYLFDKWMNQIKVDAANSQKFSIFYQNSLDSIWIVIDSSKSSIVEESTVLQYRFNLTKKGLFFFKATFENQEIKLQVSSVKIKPSSFDFNQIQLNYFDEVSNKYILLDQKTSFMFDNLATNPKFLLVLRDNYQNLLESVDLNNSLKDDLSLNLFNNQDLTINTTFQSELLQTGFLLTLKNETYYCCYKSLLKAKNPYTLNIRQISLKNSIVFPITLQGDGDDSDDCAVPDLNKTLLSKSEFKGLAGQFISFPIEIRCANDLRSRNVKIEDFSGNFTPKSSTDNFQIETSDLKGGFIVNVKSGLVKSDGVVFNMYLNQKKIEKNMILYLTPNALKYIKLLTELSIGGTADYDYIIEIQGFDEYDNLITPEEKTINLQFVFPPNSPKTYSSMIDTQNKKLIYSLKTRKSGTYQIVSSMLDNSKDYKFNIIAGNLSSETSSYKISSNLVKAGEKAIVSLSLADNFGNLIDVLNKPKILNDIQAYFSNEKEKIPITFSNDLKSETKISKIGKYILSVEILGKKLACIDCEITVEPAEILMKSTKFFIQLSLQSKIEITKLNIVLNNDFPSLQFELYDSLLNKLDPEVALGKALSFKGKIAGNNMQEIALKFNIQGQYVYMDIQSENNRTYFKSLVSADNYLISVDLYSNGDETALGTSTLSLAIVGDASDAGNGPYDKDKTAFILNNNENLRLVAGVESFFSLELRTSLNKRYNGPEKDLITIQTDAEMNITRLPNNINGRFTFSIITEKVTIGSEYKTLVVSVKNEVLSRKIMVYVEPDSPDFEKTVIIQGLPSSLYDGTQQSIIFKMYDKYGNTFENASFVDRIFAKAVKGDANMTLVSFRPEGFFVTITPHYPPKELEIYLYYKTGSSLVQINKIPLKTTILTKLSLQNTQLVGNKLASFAVDEEFSFFILLKDINGYCYELPKNVSIKIRGAFSSYDMKSEEQPSDPKYYSYSGIEINHSDSSSNSSFDVLGYTCNKYYQIYVSNDDNEAFKKAGFYQIDIYVEGENEGQPIKSIRDTRVLPGKVVIQNTLISVLQYQGKGNGGVNVKAGAHITVLMVLMDKFKNKLKDSASNVLDRIKFPNNLATYLTTTNYMNGSFLIEVKFEKVGLLDNFYFSIDQLSLQWNSLEKIDAPIFFNVVPSDCSSLNPLILNQHLTGKNILVGKSYNFTIQCLDDNNNHVISNDNTKFEISFIGKDLLNVGTDRIKPKMTSTEIGKFNFSFKIAWPGQYLISLMLNSQPYGETFYINAQNSMCSSDLANNENVFQCLNDTCVSSYKLCGYEELNCPDPKLPYKCSVNGELKCVKSSYLCDCPKDQFKCHQDFKCVSTLSLCPTSLSLFCPDEYPFKCSDNTCRKTHLDCSSPSACPPRYLQCPDLSCAKDLTQCPEFIGCPSKDFPNKVFKCSDQSCVTDPKDCPTRLTCSISDQVVCPDKNCVSSELECRTPAVCDENLVLCSDQSCRTSHSDCPKQPSCPFGKALCSDGSCRESCSLTSVDDPSLPKKCAMDQFICPGGECVSNYFLCSTLFSCPKGTLQCPDLSCVFSLSSCVQKDCLPPLTLCWDGSCQSSSSKCPTRTTCPDEYSVKCPDNQCVSDASSCKPLIQCPSYSPFRCSNSECKSQKSNCPSSITCPSELPVQCPDGTCVKASYHCLASIMSHSCSKTQVNCPDGTCALSASLCPSLDACPSDQIRCWDNSCTDDLTSCPSPKPEEPLCPENLPFRCGDGSCREKNSDCPTLMICPIERLIKCDDGTCRESRSQCAKGTGCGFGLKRCPDGSCSLAKCGTPITCSGDAPYKCYDNTCRKDPRDCLEIPSCSKEAPILCGDGRCVGQRIECTQLSACPQDLPVKCADHNCYKSSEQCLTISGCPKGFLSCEDGSCSIKAEYCTLSKCPPQLRFKCSDGFCVSNSTFCDTSSGCSSIRPFKCKNGLCVASESYCPSNNTYTCPNNKKLCPDGSCVFSSSKCNNIMGCPLETPFRCGSGLCIDPSKRECPLHICPIYLPIKCSNGLCVKSYSNCQSAILSSTDFQQCINETSPNTVPCGDGRCVASSDQCRPIYACPEGYSTCPDGTCRLLSDLCPITEMTCPSPKKYRCQSGLCVVAMDECPSSNGCPLNSPVKCEKTGHCVDKYEQCEAIYDANNLPNGCSISKPLLCPNGTCTSNQTLCQTQSYKCPNSLFSIECVDGSCVSDALECLNKTIGCSKSQTQCPDGACKDSYSQCSAVNYCPISTPFRCLDGTCKSSPINFKNLSDADSCTPGSLCPSYKPFKCADGECQGDPALCKTLWPCPKERALRCKDGSCVYSEEKCQKIQICPITTPILCQNGKCAESVIECSSSNSCPEDKPMACISGLCVKYAYQCVNAAKSVSRILENNPFKSNRLLDNVEIKIDIGCSQNKPVLCQNGLCVNSSSDCSTIPSCKNPSLPYRCKSGVCVKDETSCNQHDSLLPLCEGNSTRCPDGICRQICIGFNGCPEYHCGNGYCAKSLGECAGDSVCPLNKPFRCLNNTCVRQLNECSIRKRDVAQDPMILTLSVYQSDVKEFLFDKETNQKYGKLKIPAGALKSNGTDIMGLTLRSIPQSEVSFMKTYYDEEMYEYVSKVFPLNDGYLEFHNSIRSAIVELSTLDSTENNYRFPIVLELASDFISNSNKTKDYCLATIKNNAFECITRDLLESDTYSNESFAYPINKNGIYTIIYNPAKDVQNSEERCDFLCKNKNTIIIVCISLFVASIIFIFIVWRVSRYMSKYRQAKKQIENYKEQIIELQNNSTDVVGQTVRDKLEGISFTQNPLFRNPVHASNNNILKFY